MDVSRRRFIGGGAASAELRPPWLCNLATFTNDCTRCNRCIQLCPEGILTSGTGGFPKVDFTLGECTFCGECTSQCEAGLFARVRDLDDSGWTHHAVVSERCLTNVGVMCRSCEDACEPQAIRFRLTAGKLPAPAIDDQACTGCGACIGRCPETAISMTSQEGMR
jgi:ferredoxin-type protein NapF